jgi:hypothetical protein
MNAKIKGLAILVATVAWTAWGAFTPPTQDQLAAAAVDPALVVALVQDASMEEAARVGENVIIEIVKLDLEPEERDARIASLLKYLFQAKPDDPQSLAIELGNAVAASPTISMNSAILSGIQQTIIAIAGVDIGTAFGNAFNLAMLSIAGRAGGGKNVPPPPPPPVMGPEDLRPPPSPPPPEPPQPPQPSRPPVAQPYEGQGLP